MSIENQVIKFLSTRDNYYKYKEHAEQGVLLNETKHLIDYLGEWYILNPAKIELDWDSFRLWIRLNKQAKSKTEKKELYDRLIQEAEKIEVDTILSERLILQSYASQIGQICYKVSSGEGTESLDKVTDLLDEYKKEVVADKEGDTFNVPITADIVQQSLSLSGGLDWRLHDMNRSVGPLYKSDHIMIGKRPESGGTSFMIAEMTYMLPNLPEGKKAIIFHNEEGGYKVAARVLQTALDKTTADILSDVAAINAAFDTYKNGHDIEIYHNPDMTIYDVERKLSNGDYYLIGFNILEKVKGFKDSEPEHARYARLSGWARNLAVKYGVVFSIAQADYSAEGQPWLNQSQLMNSKTGVQQETDVLIMIGKDSDDANNDTRYISIVRNKKPALPGTVDPKFKYGKFETWFNHETGIYRCK